MTQEVPKVEAPKPIAPAALRRMLVVGALLAVGAVVLFILLWVGLGQANVENFPRLILSMCIPPAVIAVVVGAFFLFGRGANPS